MSNNKFSFKEWMLQVVAPLSIVGLMLGWAFEKWFLRKPARISPAKPYLFVSPANGTVIGIRKYDFTQQAGGVLLEPKNEQEDGAYGYVRIMADGLNPKGYIISIALKITDIHHQRVPVDGEVKQVKYVPGSFKNALRFNNEQFLRYENENCQTTFSAAYNGLKYKVVQIAGMIARRVECNLSQWQPVKQGEIMGAIKTGSQVSVLLPEEFTVTAKEGDYVIDGETVIAML